MSNHDFCTQLSADDDVPFDDSDEEDSDEEDDSSEGSESNEESSDGGDFDDDDDEDESSDDDDGEDDGREESGGRGAMKAAMSRAKKWPVRKGRRLELTVSFIGGTSHQRRAVKNHAPEWQKGTGVRFIFQKKPGKIRVAFRNDGSWSKVGTDALTVTNKEHPTMNFGWISQSTILHEFGHALGLYHEHSSPAVAIPWDKPKVYQYYRDKNNWDKATVDFNIFRVYDKTTTNYTRFDPNSIMIYTIRGDLLNRNSEWRGITRQGTLSNLDRSFMAKMYPRPKSSRN